MGKKIPRQDLIDGIREYGSELGRRPTSREMDADGPHSRSTYQDRFEGGWIEAVQLAGYEKPDVKTKIPKPDLIEAINELGDDLGRRPKLPEMDADGRYAGSTYVRRFDDGWSEAVVLAGYSDPREEPSDKYQYTNEELEAEIRRLKEKYGYISAPLMDEEGQFGIGTYIYRYDSWNDAIRTAGVEINQEWKPNTEEYRMNLVRSVRAVYNQIGDVPKTLEVYEITGDGANYLSHFSSWDEVLVATGLPPARKTVECSNCGASLSRRRYAYEQYDNHYCGRDCMTEWRIETGFLAGENNPQYTGSDYPRYGPAWTRTRRQILKRDNFRCWRCKMTQEEHLDTYGEQLHIHHITPLADFDGDYETANQPDNLVALCCSCHKKWDSLPIQPQVAD